MVFARTNTPVHAKENKLIVLGVAATAALLLARDQLWSFGYAAGLGGLWLVTFARGESQTLWPITFVAICTILSGQQWVAIVILLALTMHEFALACCKI